MGRILTTLILLVGIFWIVEGIHRGFRYGPLQGAKPRSLTVTKIYNAVNRKVFPDYRAVGFVEGVEREVEVSIFQKQFRSVRSGEAIDVYPLYSSSATNWVAAARISESKPIMNIFGFRFSWHLPAGIFLAFAAVVNWRSDTKKRKAAQTFDR